MKKSKTFNVGDKVFAKVKGYPPWPAQITGINGKKYNVEFYGTKEIGQIKGEDLAYYVRNKDKFGKSKRAGFSEAIEQIEEAILVGGGDGDDNVDECSSENNLETSSNASFSSLNSSVVEKGEKRTYKRKREPSEDFAPAKKPGRLSRRSSRTLSDTPETKDLLEQGKEFQQDISKKEEISDTEIKKEEPEEISEKASEKAKTELKRTEPEFVAIQNNTNAEMAIESVKEEVAENDVNVETENPLNLSKADIVSEEMLKHNILYAEHVLSHKAIYKNSPVEKREDTENQLLPLKLISGTMCGIKLHPAWPLKKFASEFERAMYDDTVARAALARKEEIEGNPGAVSGAPDIIGDIHMTANDIKAFLHDRDIRSKARRVRRLKVESHMVSLESKIKNCLGLDTADPKAAAAHLDELLTIEFDALMLKKHPHVVEMARRLRKYVGNMKEWELSDAEEKDFQQQAEKIRDAAEKLYLKIKTAVDVPEGQSTSFWDSFQELLVSFRERCRELTETQVLVLCAEPMSRMAFMDNINEAAIAEKVEAELTLKQTAPK